MKYSRRLLRRLQLAVVVHLVRPTTSAFPSLPRLLPRLPFRHTRLRTSHRALEPASSSKAPYTMTRTFRLLALPLLDPFRSHRLASPTSLVLCAPFARLEELDSFGGCAGPSIPPSLFLSSLPSSFRLSPFLATPGVLLHSKASVRVSCAAKNANKPANSFIPPLSLLHDAGPRDNASRTAVAALRCSKDPSRLFATAPLCHERSLILLDLCTSLIAQGPSHSRVLLRRRRARPALPLQHQAPQRSHSLPRPTLSLHPLRPHTTEHGRRREVAERPAAGLRVSERLSRGAQLPSSGQGRHSPCFSDPRGRRCVSFPSGSASLAR